MTDVYSLHSLKASYLVENFTLATLIPRKQNKLKEGFKFWPDLIHNDRYSNASASDS